MNCVKSVSAFFLDKWLFIFSFLLYYCKLNISVFKKVSHDWYDECGKAHHSIDYDSALLLGMPRYIDVVHVLYAPSSNEASYMVFFDIFWTVTASVSFSWHTVFRSQYVHAARRALLVSVTASFWTLRWWKGLTGSIKHHEDRPLLFLQQLPEVLKKSEREGGKKMIKRFYYL